MPFEYLIAYFGVVTEVISMLLLAIGLLILLRWSRQASRQQKLYNTATLLSAHHDRLIAPMAAFSQVPPAAFALGPVDAGEEQVAARLAIATYFNSLEYIATLVNTGAVDEEFASVLIRPSFVRSFHTFIEYIMRVRIANDDPTLYQQFESLAHRWGPRPGSHAKDMMVAKRDF